MNCCAGIAKSVAISPSASIKSFGFIDCCGGGGVSGLLAWLFETHSDRGRLVYTCIGWGRAKPESRDSATIC